MWPTGTWIEGFWADIWPTTTEEAQEQLVSILQELFVRTEDYSTNSIILNTNVYSNVNTIVGKIIDILFVNSEHKEDVKTLFENTFVEGDQLKVDESVVNSFASQLNDLLN